MTDQTLKAARIPNTVPAPAGFVPARLRLDRDYVRSIQQAERQRRLDQASNSSN